MIQCNWNLHERVISAVQRGSQLVIIESKLVALDFIGLALEMTTFVDLSLYLPSFVSCKHMGTCSGPYDLHSFFNLNITSFITTFYMDSIVQVPLSQMS